MVCPRLFSSRATAPFAPSTSAPSARRWSVRSSTRFCRSWGAPKWPPKPPNARNVPGNPGRSSTSLSPAVGHGGHDVVGAALEGARDTAVGLAAVLRRLHLVARQLAVGD